MFYKSLYRVKDDSLIIPHNAGFFSCCSVRLVAITNFHRQFNKLPISVDSSTQFEWYKNDTNKNFNITFDYFENYDNIDINIPNNNCYFSTDLRSQPQFTDYSKLNFEYINHFMKKYFTPSKEINNIIANIEAKYNIDYDNICTLFYRGNDKNTETYICPYVEYIKYAGILRDKNPNIKFLIQSDETEFIELFTQLFPNNSFYFKDDIRHMNKCNDTVDKKFASTNYEFSKKYLAITVIMSKCKYIICGSGNCSKWIVLYRNNIKGVYQNLNNKWIINEY